jgi:hypothetical protein
MSEAEAQTLPRTAAKGWLAGALALAALQGVLLTRTAWDKSDTNDEPYYLATSYVQWNELRFDHACDAPALPRWGFGAALRLVDPALFDPLTRGGRNPLWDRPPSASRRNLFAARMATILAVVAGGLALWRAALRFGFFSGFVAHALWSFSPALLGNGALVTLDAWTAALGGFALLATVRVVEQPRLVRVAMLGAALALAAATKVTTLGLVPIAIAVLGVVLLRRSEPIGGLTKRALLLGLTFFLTLWAVYLFETGPLDTSEPCGRATELARHVLTPLPFPSWLAGIVLQWEHGSKGHLTYLSGETSSSGFWWFYLVCLLFKTTIGAQLLALGLAVAWLAGPRKDGTIDAALLSYPLLLVVAMSLGRTQNGIRYLLPAFPFAMCWAGRRAQALVSAVPGKGALVLACLLLGAAESLAVHPHHLMFFNLWAGGPSGGPRYLVHGDDWGQDQRRLVEWQRQHPGRLFYTFYNGKPEHWGLVYQLPTCEPTPGFYALHAVEVHRPKRTKPGCLDWLTVEPPDERLGYSIYIYQVNKARIARLLEERSRIAPFWKSGP